MVCFNLPCKQSGGSSAPFNQFPQPLGLTGVLQQREGYHRGTIHRTSNYYHDPHQPPHLSDSL